MTIESFITMTRRIVARDGFNDYLPTLVLPSIRTVLVLDGLPSDVDIEQATRDLASAKADPDDDFIVAFKFDDRSIKIIARLGGNTEERLEIL